MADIFWRGWVAEYITTLQLLQKWTDDQLCVKIGDIIRISEEPSRGDWPLGRVIDVKLGSDKKPRSARVLIGGKEKIRPISKHVLLEHHHGHLFTISKFYFVDFGIYYIFYILISIYKWPV